MFYFLRGKCNNYNYKYHGTEKMAIWSNDIVENGIHECQPVCHFVSGRTNLLEDGNGVTLVIWKQSIPTWRR